MGKCALPPHLREKLHNDWPWPFKKVSRGWNAYGPRCPEGSKGYLPWPPRLVEGKGIARWEMCKGSIIDIPDLANITVKGDDIYGNEFMAWERNPGMPNFNKPLKVKLIDPNSVKVTITDSINPDGTYTQVVSPNIYCPSALQMFSKKGWIKLNPEYHSTWNILKWRELPWLKAGAIGEAPEDMVLFKRSKNRPDSEDGYYNRSIIMTVGLKWE
jgi:hypothetical protein